MTSSDTLLFPDSDILKENLYPLFLFCRPLRYLQPVEPAAGREPEEIDLFMERGLCQAYTPAPLGKDRERFLHLVNDIKHRKDEYAAQLAALSVAGLSESRRDRDDEKRSRIISTLLKDNGLSKAKATKRETTLWQARLVLAIAEILDREESELLQELQYLDNRELSMLRELQGDTETAHDELLDELEQLRGRLQIPRPREIRTRFRAWLELMGSNVPVEPEIWLASSRDAADEIFNRYEKKGSGIATPVLRLTLPGKIEASPVHLIRQVETFRKAAAAVHGSITKDLKELCRGAVVSPATVESLLPGQEDYVEKWARFVDEQFPASSHSKAYLTFYLLPDSSIADLLSLDTEAGATPGTTNGLLAILHD